MNTVLAQWSVRSCRLVGGIVAVLGIPSVFLFWHDGPAWALGILGIHLYCGGMIAFGLPWLKRQAERHDGNLPSAT